MKKIKKNKNEILIVGIFLFIQTVIFIITGMNKIYIHMDEAYSLGLASYEKTEIQNNLDFYDRWHKKEYYEDYLSVQKDEIGQYRQVYENQKNDVHPPLYYFLLKFSMGFTEGHFSKWSGIVLNIIIYIFITVFMYLLLQKLFQKEKNGKGKAIVLAFISSITMASLTNVIYIRMYALLTLTIVITTFLHTKLLEDKKIDIKLLLAIGITALAGSLTHYYYLFYLGMMYILFAIKYMKEKNIRYFIYYTFVLVLAGTLSLIIFPYSIEHMFFGYRGQGVISKLANVPEFLFSILLYLLKLDYYGFNHFFFIIIFAILGLFTYSKINKIKVINEEKSKILKIILFPTLFYFILVAIASPWIELRYIMPVCGLLFILVLFYLYELLRGGLDKKRVNIVISILFCILLVSPWIFKIEPEVLYRDKRAVVDELQNKSDIPTVYFFKSQNNRFLDDILLFTMVNESYVAKDISYTVENMKEILSGKDVSNGVIIFINEGQDNDHIIEVVKESFLFESSKHLKRLNACDVYYIN